MGATHPNATDATNDDDSENTVVVDRAGLRAARARDPASKATGRDEGDRTIVVDRSARIRATLAKPRTISKGGIGPAPVPSDFAPPAVKGTGADAIERYRPRVVPPRHPHVPTMESERAATREPSATMPSVARHARITARAAIAVFVVSCVASIVGLTLIALAIHARL